MQCTKDSFAGSSLRVKGSEQEADEDENHNETNAHEGESLHDERVLLLVNEPVADGCSHGLVFVDREQIQVDELSLGQH